MDQMQANLRDDDDDGDDGAVDELNAFAYALTPDHFVTFQRRGSGLLVSFEVEKDPAVALKSHESRFAELAVDLEWSHLTLTSRVGNPFRAPEVIAFFDALADGTLLDQFGDVLFYGAGPGGHGALSYALAAPMSRILAIAPLVGLRDLSAAQGEQVQPADNAAHSGRYLPDLGNLGAASEVFLILDPANEQDAAEASALQCDPVQALFCRDIGTPLEDALSELGVLEDILSHAMEGTLSAPVFYALLRIARRDNAAYLRRLTARLIEKDRTFLEALAVRNVARRTGRKRFAKRFDHLEASLRDKGVTIPTARPL